MKDEIKERIKYFKHYVVDNLSLDAQDDFQKISDYITTLQEENERLNNIINELEEYLEWSIGQDMYRLDFKIILDKLQELKENKQ